MAKGKFVFYFPSYAALEVDRERLHHVKDSSTAKHRSSIDPQKVHLRHHSSIDTRNPNNTTSHNTNENAPHMDRLLRIREEGNPIRHPLTPTKKRKYIIDNSVDQDIMATSTSLSLSSSPDQSLQHQYQQQRRRPPILSVIPDNHDTNPSDKDDENKDPRSSLLTTGTMTPTTLRPMKKEHLDNETRSNHDDRPIGNNDHQGDGRQQQRRRRTRESLDLSSSTSSSPSTFVEPEFIRFLREQRQWRDYVKKLESRSPTAAIEMVTTTGMRRTSKNSLRMSTPTDSSPDNNKNHSDPHHRYDHSNIVTRQSHDRLDGITSNSMMRVVNGPKGKTISSSLPVPPPQEILNDRDTSKKKRIDRYSSSLSSSPSPIALLSSSLSSSPSAEGLLDSHHVNTKVRGSTRSTPFHSSPTTSSSFHAHYASSSPMLSTLSTASSLLSSSMPSFSSPMTSNSSLRYQTTPMTNVYHEQEEQQRQRPQQPHKEGEGKESHGKGCIMMTMDHGSISTTSAAEISTSSSPSSSSCWLGLVPSTLEEAAAMIPNLPIRPRRGRRSKSELEAIHTLQRQNPVLAEQLLIPARFRRRGTTTTMLDKDISTINSKSQRRKEDPSRRRHYPLPSNQMMTMDYHREHHESRKITTTKGELPILFSSSASEFDVDNDDEDEAQMKEIDSFFASEFPSSQGKTRNHMLISSDDTSSTSTSSKSPQRKKPLIDRDNPPSSITSSIDLTNNKKSKLSSMSSNVTIHPHHHDSSDVLTEHPLNDDMTFQKLNRIFRSQKPKLRPCGPLISSPLRGNPMKPVSPLVSRRRYHELMMMDRHSLPKRGGQVESRSINLMGQDMFSTEFSPSMTTTTFNASLLASPFEFAEHSPSEFFMTMSPEDSFSSLFTTDDWLH